MTQWSNLDKAWSPARIVQALLAVGKSVDDVNRAAGCWSWAYGRLPNGKRDRVRVSDRGAEMAIMSIIGDRECRLKAMITIARVLDVPASSIWPHLYGDDGKPLTLTWWRTSPWSREQSALATKLIDEAEERRSFEARARREGWVPPSRVLPPIIETIEKPDLRGVVESLTRDPSGDINLNSMIDALRERFGASSSATM